MATMHRRSDEVSAKLAPGFLDSEEAACAPKNGALSVGTYQESDFFCWRVAPGCTVGPNNAGWRGIPYATDPSHAGVLGMAVASGSLGMTLTDYQALAAKIGWNGFASNLNPYQQSYYGADAANIIQLQAQGQNVSGLWQGVVNEMPGVINDSDGLPASDAANSARNSWLSSMDGTTVLAGATVGAVITGYTRHGLNQAISRDGVGVSPSSILDATNNPLQVNPQSGGAVEYVGQDATVIVNANGKVITTWATNSGGVRAAPPEPESGEGP